MIFNFFCNYKDNDLTKKTKNSKMIWSFFSYKIDVFIFYLLFSEHPAQQQSPNSQFHQH